MDVHPKRREFPQAERPKVRDRELDAMVAAAWDAGWWCVRTKKNHVMCFPPDTTKDGVLVANTPSDFRVVHNTRSDLRRSGLSI